MFAVISTTSIPEHLHGYLTRFLTEVDSGLYVGNLSRNVVERIWDRILEVVDDGSTTLIFNDPNREQGFSIRTVGKQAKVTLNVDGLTLVSLRTGRAVQKLKGRR